MKPDFTPRPVLIDQPGVVIENRFGNIGEGVHFKPALDP
jgi:hypothetical protein